MKFTGVFVVVLCGAFGILGLATGATQAPDTVAWTNGAWFDGTGFRRVDVYSIGDRLTLKRPPNVDRTVDLANRFVTGAFGEGAGLRRPVEELATRARHEYASSTSRRTGPGGSNPSAWDAGRAEVL